MELIKYKLNSDDVMWLCVNESISLDWSVNYLFYEER